MTMGLTTRQADTLRFIQRYTADHGYGPSYDDIRQGVGIASKLHVNRVVQELTWRGFIRRLPYRARSIEVLERADNWPLELLDSRPSGRVVMERPAVSRAPDGRALYAVPRIAERGGHVYSKLRIVGLPS